MDISWAVFTAWCDVAGPMEADTDISWAVFKAWCDVAGRQMEADMDLTVEDYQVKGGGGHHAPWRPPCTLEVHKPACTHGPDPDRPRRPGRRAAAVHKARRCSPGSSAALHVAVAGNSSGRGPVGAALLAWFQCRSSCSRRGQ
jgi:hypothetical protein